MEDVLSGQVAKELREQKEPRELIVEDRIGSLIVEASIFSWSEEDKSEESQYESLGWFKGDGGVTIDLNRVTVRVRQRNTRSQLADRFVYKARDNKTYYQENSTKLVLPDMTDWVSLSMPEDPATSEYPEKVVLAFYQNITDANKLKGLMTSDAYEALQKSDAVFDCLSQRTGALVKNMDYSQALSVPTHTENSNISITVTVSATSTCLVNDRPSGKELKLTWQVRWDKYDDKGNDKDTWILLKPKP
jgi:hypothetical protein